MLRENNTYGTDIPSNNKSPVLQLLLLQPFYGPPGVCPGLPGWAGTRKVKPGR